MKNSFNDLERGQAMMVATMFFLVVSLTIVLGLVGPVTRAQRVSTQLFQSRQSYFLAEAGLEDVVYRLRTGAPVDANETLSLNGSTATTVTTDIEDGKIVTTTGEVAGTERSVSSGMSIGTGIAFRYGIQIGNGGFILDNNAGVIGNIYSNAGVTGSNGSFITGSVYAVNTISGITVGTGTTGDANAPTVNNAVVRGTLYCKNGSGNNKACNTTATNPPSAPLPLPDEKIVEWKAEAEAGGTIGAQTIAGTATHLGPIKINGNLTLGGATRLTVDGVIWVTGNLLLNNDADVVLNSSYGTGDGVIIVDGLTTLSNNTSFYGSGEVGSYIMLLSTNANVGGNAINMQNNAGAAILYAPYGTVRIGNNADLNQVTAKTVSLAPNAVIEYLQGYIDATFVTGPSGGYEINSWREVE